MAMSNSANLQGPRTGLRGGFHAASPEEIRRVLHNGPSINPITLQPIAAKPLRDRRAPAPMPFEVPPKRPTDLPTVGHKAGGWGLYQPTPDQQRQAEESAQRFHRFVDKVVSAFKEWWNAAPVAASPNSLTFC